MAPTCAPPCATASRSALVSSKRIRAVLVAALALASACADNGQLSDCPGVNDPAVLHLDAVSPAAGASVGNEDIVHAFTVTDGVTFTTLSLAPGAGHTAGDPTTALSFSYALTDAGTVYSAEPVTWQNAPGHVELDGALVYQTDDGCAYQLPAPVFEYDVTAP